MDIRKYISTLALHFTFYDIFYDDKYLFNILSFR